MYADAAGAALRVAAHTRAPGARAPGAEAADGPPPTAPPPRSRPHRASDINKSGAAVVGRPVRDIIGRSNRELFGEAIAKEMDKHVLESYRNRSTVSIEHEVPGTEGTKKTYSTLYSYHASTADAAAGAHGAPRAPKRQRGAGGEAFIFGVCRDITMRKLLETNALEATNAKTRFLANMSHDLRTPLTGIINVAHLLKAGNLGKEERDLVSILVNSSSVLLSLCNDITDISKVEQQEMVLHHQKGVDVARCIGECVDMAKPQATHNGLTIRMEDPVFKPLVDMDPVRLRQIANNLISNAIKYTMKGGVKVTLACACPLPPRGRAAGAAAGKAGAAHCEVIQIRLIVADTGIGISANDLETIFRPYAQVVADGVTPEDRAKQVHEGSGLGLAIARGLARVMGGDISATSVERRGSEFTATVEASIRSCVESTRPDAGAAAGAGEPARGGRGAPAATSSALQKAANRDKFFGELAGKEIKKMWVMLVEDNCVTMVVLRKLLEHYGVAHIITAVNGLDAVEKLRTMKRGGAGAGGDEDEEAEASGDVQLILMDWNMPQLDGLSATKLIRQDKSLGRQPLIYILTAAAMFGDKEQCLLSGADGYLTKPINDEQLINVLLKAAHTSRVRGAAAAAAELG